MVAYCDLQITCSMLLSGYKSFLVSCHHKVLLLQNIPLHALMHKTTKVHLDKLYNVSGKANESDSEVVK